MGTNGTSGYADEEEPVALSWAEAVDTPGELADMGYDETGTGRFCLSTNTAYVKEGPTWRPFGCAGSAIHTNAVDRLARVAQEKTNGQA